MGASTRFRFLVRLRLRFSFIGVAFEGVTSSSLEDSEELLSLDSLFISFDAL